jgi:hypothetical protein
VLSQVIIFILGWPLEWTEIIVIFMPIFIPLLDNFGVDPLFFGLLVALNLQTAFLSPPVAMAAFYLKGVSPPHVTLNQIFAGMLPFMGIQVWPSCCCTSSRPSACGCRRCCTSDALTPPAGARAPGRPRRRHGTQSAAPANDCPNANTEFGAVVRTGRTTGLGSIARRGRPLLGSTCTPRARCSSTSCCSGTVARWRSITASRSAHRSRVSCMRLPVAQVVVGVVLHRIDDVGGRDVGRPPAHGVATPGPRVLSTSPAGAGG